MNNWNSVLVLAILANIVQSMPRSKIRNLDQGCTLACEGCWNKQYWSHRGGKNFSVQDLVNRISNTLDEGITLLGGNLTTTQAHFKLISEVKKWKNNICARGYNVEEFDEVAGVFRHLRYSRDWKI